jgi:hypothetical protein
VKEVDRKLAEKALLAHLPEYNQHESMRMLSKELIGLHLLQPQNVLHDKTNQSNSIEPAAARMDDLSICHVPVQHVQIYCNRSCYSR